MKAQHIPCLGWVLEKVFKLRNRQENIDNIDIEKLLAPDPENDLKYVCYTMFCVVLFCCYIYWFIEGMNLFLLSINS